MTMVTTWRQENIKLILFLLHPHLAPTQFNSPHIPVAHTRSVPLSSHCSTILYPPTNIQSILWTVCVCTSIMRGWNTLHNDIMSATEKLRDGRNPDSALFLSLSTDAWSRTHFLYETILIQSIPLLHDHINVTIFPTHTHTLFTRCPHYSFLTR